MYAASDTSKSEVLAWLEAETEMEIWPRVIALCKSSYFTYWCKDGLRHNWIKISKRKMCK